MTKCDICGNKIALFTGDALSETLKKYKICDTCYRKKEELLSLHSIDDNVLYFQKYLDSVQNEDVREYLLYVINTPQRNTAIIARRLEQQRKTSIVNDKSSNPNGIGLNVDGKVSTAKIIGIITLSIGTIASIFEINHDDGLVLPGSLLLFILAVIGIVIGGYASIKGPIHMTKSANWAILICALGMVMSCVSCTLAVGYR